MDKVYNHNDIEERIYKFWEEKGYFKPEINPKGKPYSIILPPPNANGALHFGHAMFTVEDILIRFKRMQGFSALWLPGTDHAGIETQFVFEKKLKEMGKSRLDFDRETLYKMIWDYVRENRGGIEKQLRRLGFSLDWSREKYTLDPEIVKLVYKTFKWMYDDGLIYRDYRLVNYCTFDGTSFSDLEVLNEEKESTLYFIKYKIKEGGFIIVSTTRPETMFGDAAIMVHPGDKRYKEFFKKTALIPIINKEIPIIIDDSVDPKFGTGAVKVTPLHDFNDFEVAKRHNLSMQTVVIGFDGKMKNVKDFENLFVKQARQKVIEKLKELNFLEKEEPHKMVARICYKCKNLLEPLPLEQWFVKVKPLAEKAIKAVKDGKIKITPSNFGKIYFDWLENLRDWNISRQIVWGIRIPAWKNKKTGKWIVTEGEKPEGNYEQDTDTFDTWFSSGQWPYLTLMTSYGLPKMGFHEEVVPQVLKGKTKTYRLRDHEFKIGDKVLFENTQAGVPFGYGIITEAQETTIEQINYKDKTHYKTYESLDELIDAFKLRNPDKTVTRKSKAYLYAYEFHPLKDFSTDFDKFYPTDVLETGYDILKVWVTRMVMLGIYIQKKLGEKDENMQIPFKNVLFHGIVNDPYGKKMSKSKGNVIDPLELVDEYGADAVRFALIFGNATGNDQVLSYPKLDAARKFTNKLWNMARFIEMKKVSGIKYQVLNIEELIKISEHEKDKEMIHRTIELIKVVTNHLEKYDFNYAAETLYDFIWHTFADKYIEDVKNRVNSESYIILTTLYLILLKLLHPFMPFITEEIYQKFVKGKSLMISEWPFDSAQGKPNEKES